MLFSWPVVGLPGLLLLPKAFKLILMTPVTALRTEQLAPREVIAFPQIDEFYDMLQYRLNMSVSEFIFPHHFTVFINALPRDRTIYIDRYSHVNLIYGGVKRQRSLLCELTGKAPNPALDQYWDYLDHTALNSNTAVVSSQLYQAFSSGNYKMSDIEQVGMGRLKQYFASILDPNHNGVPPTPRQVAEYHILREFFNIEADYYFSVPLVMFGEFDGVMHFVYTAADAPIIKPRAIGSVIRSASAMIESQVLEWDLVGRNPEKSKAILMPLESDFYEHVNRNPILRELRFQNYYRKYLGFYQKRIRFNDDVIHSKVYRPYLKAAITAIMIDSFAHNVSAHSLVALNWWFKQRAENLRTYRYQHLDETLEMRELVETHVPEGYERDRIFSLLKPWITGLFVRNADPNYDLVNFPGPLAREIQPLIKFLMQKGAFWSGISRDNHFGGESASAFDVLWNDFINNPLYLGTIAKSEDIHRLRFRVIIYEPFAVGEVDEAFPERRPKRPLVDGIFVEVDLKTMRAPVITQPNGKKGYPLNNMDCLCLEEYPELEDMSDFVAPGADYRVIKAALDACRLFFPGEVVGRHAFFTLLENKIRNVKHFKGNALRQMQQDGLELCISFQERPVKTDVAGNRSLYSVGVWLNGVVNLWLKDGEMILQSRFLNATKGIMDENSFAPRLGGSSQDKLCASMLFNNYFLHVQNGDGNELRDRSEDTERDAAFYPWIIPASSPLDDMHNDVEFNTLDPAAMALIKQRYWQDEGYLKKYFHIWKAADIQWIADPEDAEFIWDNLARFKFIGLNAASPEMEDRLFNQVRSKGVLRVISSGLEPDLSGEAAIYWAYQRWLRDWMGSASRCIRLFVDNANVGQFVYDTSKPEAMQYYPVWELATTPPAAVGITQDLHIAHGGDSDNQQLLRYRNHGIYVKYFQSELVPHELLSDKAKVRMAEFFEVLATRIYIFDSRVFYRIGNAERRQTLARQLLLHIFDETNQEAENNDWLGHWTQQREWIIRESHFLVLHLSFIEKILVTKYGDHPDFADENIGLFIQEEIMPFVTDSSGQVRENFVLVITTGRGRTKWWTRLTEEDHYSQYRRFTSFRPVESIISAIEDAVSRRDDIETKFNLVKVMFGS